MKPARLDYLCAETLAEAHEALAAEGDDARVIAGGQTLLPMLSMRLARPKLLVDIMRLPELRNIASVGDAIRIGAGVRQAELLAWPELAQRQPLRRRAIAAPCAAPPRMPIQARKSRWSCWRSAVRSSCPRAASGAACRQASSSPA
jgi:2-furoyl-CoA dehydrogenase FAD binding subunit